MYYVDRTLGDKFYLRLLLTHVTGASGFDNLRTYQGVLHNSFAEAAKARGLAEGNQECNEAMTEAAVWKMPQQLRSMFATFLVYSATTNARETWDHFRQNMTEDLQYQAERIPGAIVPLPASVVQEIEYAALRLIDNIF